MLPVSGYADHHPTDPMGCFGSGIDPLNELYFFLFFFEGVKDQTLHTIREVASLLRKYILYSNLLYSILPYSTFYPQCSPVSGTTALTHLPRYIHIHSGAFCVSCVSHKVLLIGINTPVWHMTGYAGGWGSPYLRFPCLRFQTGRCIFYSLDASAVLYCIGTRYGFRLPCPYGPLHRLTWIAWGPGRHVVRALNTVMH